MSRTRSRAQTEAEALEALRLHNHGFTEDEIAKRMTQSGMSISQPTVHRRIMAALELYVVPALEEARKVELAKLDSYLEALSHGVTAGDVNAVKTAVSISHRRAAMLGLDKPSEVTVEIEHGSSIQEKIERAKVILLRANREAIEQ